MTSNRLLWWQRNEDSKASIREALAVGVDVDAEIDRAHDAFRSVRPTPHRGCDAQGRTSDEALLDWVREVTTKTRLETSGGTECQPDLHVWRRNGTNFDRGTGLASFRPCVCMQLDFGDLVAGQQYVIEYRGRDGVVPAGGVHVKG